MTRQCMLLMTLTGAMASAASAETKVVSLTAERIATVADAHCDVPRPSPDGRWLSYVVENNENRERAVMLLDTGDGSVERIQPRLDDGDMDGLSPADEIERLERANAPGDAIPARVCHEFMWQPRHPRGAYVVACDAEGEHYDLFYSAGQKASPHAISRHKANELHPNIQAAPGNAVAFGSSRRSKGDIFVIDTPAQVGSGDTARPLVGSGGAAESSPVWSPDGRSIVYVSASKSEEDLYVIAAERGAEPRRLTRLAGAESEPRWSPDGRLIAFFSSPPDTQRVDLYVVDAAAGKPRILARDVIKSDGAGPAWTPDGAGLVYVAHADPLNPLQVIWLESSTVRRLDTGTLLNRAPAITRRPDGSWWLVWAAQAEIDDRQKRWHRIYGTGLAADGAELR